MAELPLVGHEAEISAADSFRPRPSPLLRERERECLTWSARGKTSSEIARIIGTSRSNVDYHIANACRRLNVATRLQAAVKAAVNRLIEP